MRTFDDGGTGNGRWDSLKRDLKTLRRILMMVIGYWTYGRRVRKAYQKSETAGEIYRVDGEH